MRNGRVGHLVKPFQFDGMASTLLAYRRWRNSLDGDTPLSQAEVDRLRRLLASPYEDELPKGLDRLTLDSITEFLVRHREYLTAEEVAEQVGTSRVTARRYLEYLAEVSQADVRLPYGAVGSPVRRYDLIDLRENTSCLRFGLLVCP